MLAAFWLSNESVFGAGSFSSDNFGTGRWIYGILRILCDAVANKCEKVLGLFDDLPNGVYDAAMWAWRIFDRRRPHHRPRILQSLCFSRSGTATDYARLNRYLPRGKAQPRP